MRKTHFVSLNDGNLFFLDIDISPPDRSLIQLSRINKNTLHSELIHTIERRADGKLYFGGIEFDVNYFKKTKKSKILRFLNDLFSASVSLASGFVLNELLVGTDGVGLDALPNGVANTLSEISPILHTVVGGLTVVYCLFGVVRSLTAIQKANENLTKIGKEIAKTEVKKVEIAEKLAKTDNLELKQFYFQCFQYLNHKSDYLKVLEDRERYQRRRSIVRGSLYAAGLAIGSLTIVAGITGILSFVPYLVLVLGLLFSLVNTYFAKIKKNQDNEAVSHQAKRCTQAINLLESGQKDVLESFIKDELGIENGDEFQGNLHDRLLLKLEELGGYRLDKGVLRSEKYDNYLKKDLPFRLLVASGTILTIFVSGAVPLYIAASIAFLAQLVITRAVVYFFMRSFGSLRHKPNMDEDVNELLELTELKDSDSSLENITNNKLEKIMEAIVKLLGLTKLKDSDSSLENIASDKPEKIMEAIVNLSHHARPAGVPGFNSDMKGFSSDLSITTDDLKDADYHQSGEDWLNEKTIEAIDLNRSNSAELLHKFLLFTSKHGLTNDIEKLLNLLEKKEIELQEKVNLQPHEAKKGNIEQRKVIIAVLDTLSELIKIEQESMRKNENNAGLFNDSAKKLFNHGQKFNKYEQILNCLNCQCPPMSVSYSPSFFHRKHKSQNAEVEDRSLEPRGNAVAQAFNR